MSTIAERIAGAPITWGVDGSPGWGHLMDRDRVLAEMASLGLAATELGPDGYLGTSPSEVVARVEAAGLRVVGGFVPLILYRPDLWTEQASYAERAAATLAACGSQVLVLGPAAAHDGYDESVELDDDEWGAVKHHLELVGELCTTHGLTVALHQHWGMAVERPHHVERILADTSVDLCLDTGHFFLAGIDPVATAKEAASRIAHVHLKDVDGRAAERVRAGEVPFRQAVIDGLFRPLGHGDVDVAGVITTLEASGFTGWYVLEQDVSLTGPPPAGEGPIEDARASLEYIGEVAGR